MKKYRWGLVSFIVHGTTASLLLLNNQPSKEVISPPIGVKPISQKELDKKVKEFDSKIAKTAKGTKKTKSLERVLLSDKDSSTDKNQRAKKNDKFINSDDKEFKEAPKSITQKGKLTQESKGKGVSATDDYIDGATIGPMTILNTQEFKYFNYYERLKGRVVETWRPIVRKAIKIVKNNPKKYGDLIPGWEVTKLLVRLNSSGEIIDITIKKGSSFAPFDEAGIKAFKDCSPYAAPPAELVKNDSFELRWDFIVNVEEAGLVEFKSGLRK